MKRKSVLVKGTNLQYIEEQDEEIIKAALTENFESLQFVKHQTEEICIYALNVNWQAAYHIKYNLWTEKVLDMCYKKMPRRRYSKLMRRICSPNRYMYGED